jgi:hypothetical protein
MQGRFVGVNEASAQEPRKLSMSSKYVQIDFVVIVHEPISRIASRRQLCTMLKYICLFRCQKQPGRHPGMQQYKPRRHLRRSGPLRHQVWRGPQGRGHRACHVGPGNCCFALVLFACKFQCARPSFTCAEHWRGQMHPHAREVAMLLLIMHNKHSSFAPGLFSNGCVVCKY